MHSPSLVLLLLPHASALLRPATSALNHHHRTSAISCTASASATSDVGEANGLDDEFPYRFDGRLWFRPAIVPMPKEPLPGDVKALGLFGYTVGGSVCLEYDESPVGPYVEYVTMGALCTKRGALGQWGSHLFVSTQPAEEVCQRVWSVPAEVASITFDDTGGGGLSIDQAPSREIVPAGSGATSEETIKVTGWEATRIEGSSADGGDAFAGLPVLWTPSIKALWAPLVPLPPLGEWKSDLALPLHRLRLSASSLRLRWCGQGVSDRLGVPIPIGLAVDGLRIEIGREEGNVL